MTVGPLFSSSLRYSSRLVISDVDMTMGPCVCTAGDMHNAPSCRVDLAVTRISKYPYHSVVQSEGRALLDYHDNARVVV